MGEFADIANERWADGDWEEDEMEDADVFGGGKTCRYCGMVGLRWSSTSSGWRLSNPLGIHVCLAFKAQKQKTRYLGIGAGLVLAYF